MKFFILPKLVHLSSLQILFRNATFRIDLVKSRNLLSHANREDALVKDFIILENNFFFFFLQNVGYSNELFIQNAFCSIKLVDDLMSSKPTEAFAQVLPSS